MQFFLDTYALIAIIQGNSNFQKYSEEEGITLKTNLMELYYILLRDYGESAAEQGLQQFESIGKDIPINSIRKAMKFRNEHRKQNFSYIDCLGYMFARENKILFVTGDNEFKGKEGVEFRKEE